MNFIFHIIILITIFLVIYPTIFVLAAPFIAFVLPVMIIAPPITFYVYGKYFGWF